MRILYVWHEPPDWFHRDPPPTQVFVDAGHTVELYNSGALGSSLLEVAEVFGPDFIYFEYHTLSIVGHYCGVRTEHLAALKSRYPKLRMGCWVEDVRFVLWERLIASSRWLDVVWVNHDDPKLRQVWRTAGYTGPLLTMYGSVWPKTYHDPEIQPEYDVVFAGKNYGSLFPFSIQRRNFIYALNAQTRFSFAVAGEGWEELRPRHYAGVLSSAAAVGRFLQSGRVIFGTNHFDGRRYYPKRWWEALAAGRGLVYRTIDGADEDGFDVVATWFKVHTEELLQAIEQALSYWESAGSANHDLFRRYHTWDRQLRPVLDYLGTFEG